jgi:transcriptional regulator with XRE-family HTH domain
MNENKPAKAPERFIRLLKKAMDEQQGQMSLRQVARNADISPAYLSLLLKGERGVPSNDAIGQLERVLNIPDGELFKAAQRPNNQALEFFRKEEAGPIVRELAAMPKSQLPDILKMIKRYVKKQRGTVRK